MKKIFLAFIATLSVAVVFAQNINDISQKSFLSSEKSPQLFDKTSTRADMSQVSNKALKDFSKNYSAASDVNWSILQNGFMAAFFRDGNLNRVYYDKKGSWLFDINSYGESLLPKEIRKQVKSIYYDFAIKSVQEIIYPGKRVYIIFIAGDNSEKQLRLSDGEMEVMQDFQNQNNSR